MQHQSRKHKVTSVLESPHLTPMLLGLAARCRLSRVSRSRRGVKKTNSDSARMLLGCLRIVGGSRMRDKVAIFVKGSQHLAMLD